MLFEIVKFLIKCFMHFYFRITVHNIENFPKEGAAIIAINHRSYWDVPLCVSVLPRRLYFMAKHDLFQKPVLGKIIKWAGSFPVSRNSADLGAIKMALTILKSGKCMAIFPEGRRVKGDDEHTAKSGVSLIAAKASAPVIPIGIKGKYGFLSKIDIYIGSPIYVKNEGETKLSQTDMRDYAEKIMNSVLELAGEHIDSNGC